MELWKTRHDRFLASTSLIVRIQFQVSFSRTRPPIAVSSPPPVIVSRLKASSLDFHQDGITSFSVLASLLVTMTHPAPWPCCYVGNTVLGSRYDDKFVSTGFPGDELTVKLHHIGIRDGNFLSSIEIPNVRDEKVIRCSLAKNLA